MSLLFARLGLVESRAASLSVLRRGSKKRVPGEWQQIRLASWWKLSDDGGSEGNAFGVKRESKEEEDRQSDFTKEQRQRSAELRQQYLEELDKKELEEEKQQELEFRKNTIESIRKKGWFPDELAEEAEAEEARRLQPDRSSPEKRDADLSLSLMSEDAFWEETSRDPATGEENPSTETARDLGWALNGNKVSSTDNSTETSSMDDAHKSAWSLTEDEMSEEAKQQKMHQNSSRPELTSRRINQATNRNDAHYPRRNVYAEDAPNQSTPYDESLLAINYVTRLPIALEEKDQDIVARCLYTAQQRLDFDFIHSIPEATFTEILHVLDARRNLGNLSDTYKNISEHVAWQIGIIPQEQLMSDHGLMLQEIAMIRRRSGHQLTASQYLILLRSAGDLGQLSLATKLWEYMQHDGVVPDIDTFNAYLSAFVWNGHNNSTTRHHDRVIDHYMLRRKAKRGGLPYFNYSVGSPMGIKDRSMVILDAMLKNGITANEETYREIITAAAREGELDTVESILQITWNINVSNLMQANVGDEEVPTPKALPKDSPQYPTIKLLTTLAHAFAINNKIPTALRLVDHISREYDIPITTDTWGVLFEWTYVLSSLRSGTAARGDRSKGLLPLNSLSKLWDTMTGAPYFIKPTISMYNHLIRNLLHRESLIEALTKMGKAEEIDEAVRYARREAWATLELCVKQQQDGKKLEKPLAVARRHWEDMTVAVARNLRWKKSWIRLFCKSLQGWHRGSWSHDHSIALRVVPRVLWVWQSFTDSTLKYDLPTGVLEVHLTSEKDMLRQAVRNESLILRREKILNKAKVLVGDDLIRAPKDPSTNEPVAATTRLRKERNRDRMRMKRRQNSGRLNIRLHAVD
jgi:pentatricopeptide repeat protein